MGALSDNFRNGVAPRLLNKFGEPAILMVPGEPDSGADPWDPAPEPTEVSVQVAPMDIKEMRRPDTLIQATDWTGIMTANFDTVPGEEMKIRIEGVERQIIYVKKIRAQGDSVAYEVAARK